MKKTIKYAGIAAATLLAISPVATQVLTESGTVVKAATTATPSDDDIKIMDDLRESFNDTAYSDTAEFPNILGDNLGFDSSFIMMNGNNATQFIDSKFFKSLKDTKTIQMSDNTLSPISILNQVVDSKGNALNISDDNAQSINSPNFANALDLVKNVSDNGGTLKLRATIMYNNKAYGDPIDYSLTNSDMISTSSEDAESVANTFQQNLKSNVALNDRDYQNNGSNLLSLDMGPSNAYNLGFYYPGQKVFYSQNMDELFKTSVISKALSDISTSVQDALKKEHINVVVKATNADGTPVTSKAGLDNIGDNKESFKLAFSFQYPDGKGNIQTIDNNAETSFEHAKVPSSVDGTYDNKPIHVKDGSKVSDVDFGSLTLKAGDDSYASEAKASGNLYLTEADAWNSLTDNPPQPETIDTFDASKKAEYYQVVSAPVPGDLSDFMGKWLDDSNWSDGNSVNYKLLINGQEIPINMDSNQMWVIPDAPIKVWASNNAIYYIREINVDKSDSNSNNNNNSNNSGNIQSISGVATTHNDNGFYFLYNDNNEKVDNRALGKNSSWKVDEVRTVNGVKQYRVSTHEWVNASDVDFDENGEITEGMSVQKLDTPKQINLGTKHSRYGLHNSKLKLSTTRALAGGTSWIVDKVGTDSNGDTYYGVSTDEFVKAGDGVTLVK
ncbi:SLAP domain-containing protein [Companilactobacillus tucceti]|nr:SLAP domain-containing protein [Companilactobacillus tucceti]